MKMTHNDKVPELTNRQFNDFVKDKFVLIDFFAEWCMPCVTMGPVIDELSEKFKGKIKFGKVNVEDNQEIARKFNISSIPNFVFFKNGEPVKQFVGAISEEEFEERLKVFVK